MSPGATDTPPRPTEREGALARHFIPTRSTDHRLSEWPYYDQDYITVPPLSFMAHYAAVRMFRHADPVVLAKVLAQLQIFAGVLIAAALFSSTLGFWPALVGLSFLIWTLPFLVWFINGYFPTTTALLVQLAFTAWVLQCVSRWADGHGPAGRGALTRPMLAAAGLAALGVCTESLCLAVNGAVTIVFLALSALSFRARRADARSWFALAAATAFGTAVTLAGIVALYATRTEFTATFADRFSDRSGLKGGRAPVLEHARIVFRQTRTAWPKWLVLAMACAAVTVAIWCAFTWWRGRSRTARRQAAVGIAALWLALVPSTIYHFVLASHVTIHWWFAGTWTIAWLVTLAMALVMARRWLFAVWPARRALRAGYPALCALVLLIPVAGSWSRTDLAGWSRGLAPKTYPISMYHALGDRLPRDGYPLVAVELGELFRDYPFSTAYLRRPIVLLHYDALALPWEDEPADLNRLQELREAYVAYDPAERHCRSGAVPLPDWTFDRIAVCRVPASELLALRSAVG